MGGQAWIYNGEGSLSATFSMPVVPTCLFRSRPRSWISASSGSCPHWPSQGFRSPYGRRRYLRDMGTPSTLRGDINLNLSKILVEPQSIMGFSIPRLSISEGVAELEMSKAKGAIKTLRLGKPGNAADDINATATGEIALGKQWSRASYIKTRFSFSENVMRSFVLLDALLGQAKQADGSYAYGLSGPVAAPNATPGGGA